MAAKADNLEKDIGFKKEHVRNHGLSLGAMLGLKREVAVIIETGKEHEPIKGYDDVARWPAWKTTLLVLSLCAGFWVCTAAFILAFLG